MISLGNEKKKNKNYNKVHVSNPGCVNDIPSL